jgi:hypothetical protein
VVAIVPPGCLKTIRHCEIVGKPDEQFAQFLMAIGVEPMVPPSCICARKYAGAMAIGRMASVRHEADQVLVHGAPG